MNVAGIDKAALLVLLFAGAKQQGMGFLDCRGQDLISQSQAEEIINNGGGRPRLSFDYLYGRALKINLGGDEIDTWAYNRDNGEGRAEHLVAAYRAQSALMKAAT